MARHVHVHVHDAPRFPMDLQRATDLGKGFHADGWTESEVRAWVSAQGYGDVTLRRILSAWKKQDEIERADKAKTIAAARRATGR